MKIVSLALIGAVSGYVFKPKRHLGQTRRHPHDHHKGDRAAFKHALRATLNKMRKTKKMKVVAKTTTTTTVTMSNGDTKPSASPIAVRHDAGHELGPMSDGLKQMIVDRHNLMRKNVGADNLPADFANSGMFEPTTGQCTAADMREMRWSEELQKDAERWAKNCIYKHPKRELSAWNEGENLAKTSGTLADYDDAAVAAFVADPAGGMSWWGESQDAEFHSTGSHITMTALTHSASRPCQQCGAYNPDGSCEEGSACVTGHYRQVMWPAASQVGCAYAYCPANVFYNGDNDSCTVGSTLDKEDGTCVAAGDAATMIVCRYDHSPDTTNRAGWTPGKKCALCPFNCNDGVCQDRETLDSAHPSYLSGAPADPAKPDELPIGTLTRRFITHKCEDTLQYSGAFDNFINHGMSNMNYPSSGNPMLSPAMECTTRNMWAFMPGNAQYGAGFLMDGLHDMACGGNVFNDRKEYCRSEAPKTCWVIADLFRKSCGYDKGGCKDVPGVCAPGDTSCVSGNAAKCGAPDAVPADPLAFTHQYFSDSLGFNKEGDQKKHCPAAGEPGAAPAVPPTPGEIAAADAEKIMKTINEAKDKAQKIHDDSAKNYGAAALIQKNKIINLMAVEQRRKNNQSHIDAMQSDIDGVKHDISNAQYNLDTIIAYPGLTKPSLDSLITPMAGYESSVSDMLNSVKKHEELLIKENAENEEAKKKAEEEAKKEDETPCGMCEYFDLAAEDKMKIACSELVKFEDPDGNIVEYPGSMLCEDPANPSKQVICSTMGKSHPTPPEEDKKVLEEVKAHNKPDPAAEKKGAGRKCRVEDWWTGEKIVDDCNELADGYTCFMKRPTDGAHEADYCWSNQCYAFDHVETDCNPMTCYKADGNGIKKPTTCDETWCCETDSWGDSAMVHKSDNGGKCSTPENAYRGDGTFECPAPKPAPAEISFESDMRMSGPPSSGGADCGSDWFFGQDFCDEMYAMSQMFGIPFESMLADIKAEMM